VRNHFNGEKPDVVCVPVSPETAGSINRITVEASMGQKMRPYLQNNQSKKSWKAWLK
jgi:hypothetical protein